MAGGRAPLPGSAFRGPFVVAGTAMLDVRATPALTGQVCAPGTVTLCPGGSGRNIAEDLARLGHQARLLSAVGDDLAGRILLQETAAAGVDASRVAVKAGLSSGFFVAFTGRGGAVRQAVAQSRAREAVDAAYLREAAPQSLAGARTLVAELALSVTALDALLELAREAGLAICLEAASAARKPPRLRFAAGADLVKGNFSEMTKLTGVEGSGELAAARAACLVVEAGAGAALVTMGAAGALLAFEDRGLRLRHPPFEPLDTTGAGDAFLAGLLDAASHGLGWAGALRAAGAAERLAISTHFSSPVAMPRESLAALEPEMTVEEL